MKHLKPIFESNFEDKAIDEKADIVEDIFMELIDEGICDFHRVYQEDIDSEEVNIYVLIEQSIIPKYTLELEELAEKYKKSIWVTERITSCLKKLENLGVNFSRDNIEEQSYELEKNKILIRRTIYISVNL